MSRYANLTSVGDSLKTNGIIVKAVGLVAAAAGVFGGIQVGGGMGIAVGVAAVVGGLLLHSVGTLIAAAGEGLLAVKDVAEHTARLPERTS